jgi:hypothetical protein
MTNEIKPEYSLNYKKKIIRELLKQTMEIQSEIDANDVEGVWLWYQAERVTYMTVLDILNDNLECLADETIERARKELIK